MGAVADVHPGLVREVARRGHEIGSHTYAHELIYRQQRSEFRADVARSRQQLQDLTGQPVLGFRAPEFSVGDLGHWTFDVLAEVGFAYDSSVFPIDGARYGISGAPLSPFTITSAGGTVWEFPLATLEIGGHRVPVAGGSYYRVLPGSVLRRALARMDHARRPAVLYFHPYEFHRGWLYLPGLSWRQRLNLGHLRFGLLHNLATGAVAGRLRSVLREFKFAPLGELYRGHAANAGAGAPESLASSH